MSTELKSRLRLTVLVIMLAFPIALLLAWLRDGAIRDLIALPFLYMAWLARVYVRSVPRPLFWGGLLIFGVVLAVINVLTALHRRRGDDDPVLDAELRPDYRGKVRQLTSQIRFAARSLYFKRSLAKRLGRLILESRDYGGQYQPAELGRTLDALGASEDVRRFFEDGEELVPSSRRAGVLLWFQRRLRSRDRASAPPSDLEKVVQFLEDRLEVL